MITLSSLILLNKDVLIKKVLINPINRAVTVQCTLPVYLHGPDIPPVLPRLCHMLSSLHQGRSTPASLQTLYTWPASLEITKIKESTRIINQVRIHKLFVNYGCPVRHIHVRCTFHKG